MLQPTSPLRGAHHIDAALSLFEGAGSVISVVAPERHPYRSLILDSQDEVKPVRSLEDLEDPLTSLPKAFVPNGAIYVCLALDIQSAGKLFHEPIRLYQMESDVSVDIDTAEDFRIVEELIEDSRKGSQFI